jgi:8-oxo-dGTP pyrophosphatase MutT (NUDIX family)
MQQTLFQYCPKLVVFRNNDQEVLLARRAGEQDYNATYSFIGGKSEVTDADLIEALRREKNEEVGSEFLVKINPHISWNIRFNKKDGSAMIIPHHYAQHVSGSVVLNDEYDDYKWLKVSELKNFEPKIKNIPTAVSEVLKLKSITNADDFVVL